MKSSNGVDAAIENRDPWWWSCAMSALHAEARTGREFAADTLTDEYGVDAPDHPNRWGALFRAAHAEGVIEPVGYRPSRRPSRAGGACRTWRGTRPGAA